MSLPQHIRHQFYDIQDRRCPVCDNDIEWGKKIRYDEISGVVMDLRCYLLVIQMRKYKGPVLDRAIKLVAGCNDSNDKNTSRI